jgi:hypothetical protein
MQQELEFDRERRRLEEEDDEEERRRQIEEEEDDQQRRKELAGIVTGGCAVHCYGVMVAENVFRDCDGRGPGCR